MTLLAFLGTLAAGLVAAQASTEKRVALVVGNSAYTAAPALSNPVIDAKAVAASLKRLGFEVIEGYDLNFAGMRTKLGEFSTALSDARAGLVYYAGHGVSVDEENYLLPTDIALKSVSDLELNAMNLSLILRQMKREERVNVVILDACRDNPFARELATGRGRSVVAERGLSRIDNELAKGTLIAFATDPKSTAMDGRAGENSPFTKALLRHIETPGVSIDTVMNRVRAEVWDSTKNKQMPWVNTSIIGEFILNPGAQVAALQPAAQPQTAISGAAPPAPPIAAAPDRVTMENRFWESAERGNTVDDYRAYLDAYPNGIYAAMARSRVARLDTRAPQTQQQAVAPAAAPLAAPASPAAAPVPTIDVAALKAETGTMQSEQALKLDLAQRKEVQARLNALQFAAGAENGKFAEKTRKAIADWQKSRDLAATGWLGKLQLAALNEQSESPYQRAREAQRMAPATPVANTRNLGKQKAVRQAPPPGVSPAIREAQRERAVIRAQQRAAGPRPTYAPGPAPGAGAAFGSFLGGVAAGAIIGGAFRR
ncbi:MAG: caspase family protein [Methylobacteriaceae bacterium]|nr:caspase family protein [Methylobacteriaceae bacterium]